MGGVLMGTNLSQMIAQNYALVKPTLITIPGAVLKPNISEVSAFQMAQTPVTRDEYREYLGSLGQNRYAVIGPHPSSGRDTIVVLGDDEAKVRSAVYDLPADQTHQLFPDMGYRVVMTGLVKFVNSLRVVHIKDIVEDPEHLQALATASWSEAMTHALLHGGMLPTELQWQYSTGMIYRMYKTRMSMDADTNRPSDVKGLEWTKDAGGNSKKVRNWTLFFGDSVPVQSAERQSLERESMPDVHQEQITETNNSDNEWARRHVMQKNEHKYESRRKNSSNYFGLRMMRLRLDLNLSLQEFRKMLHLDESQLSLYERNRRNVDPKLGAFLRIVLGSGKDPSYFLDVNKITADVRQIPEDKIEEAGRLLESVKADHKTRFGAKIAALKMQQREFAHFCNIGEHFIARYKRGHGVATEKAIRIAHATRGFITIWDMIGDKEYEAIIKDFNLDPENLPNPAASLLNPAL